jgi:glutaminyl-tRNA synthetase
MPPKFDPNDPAVAELISLFQSIGLSPPKATEAARAKSAPALKDIIRTHDLSTKSLDEKQALFISSVATQGAKLGPAEKRYLIDAIVDRRLKSGEQLSGEPGVV